jgi:hypothetical protein
MHGTMNLKKKAIMVVWSCRWKSVYEGDGREGRC